jgi:hypothetical protein
VVSVSHLPDLAAVNRGYSASDKLIGFLAAEVLAREGDQLLVSWARHLPLGTSSRRDKLAYSWWIAKENGEEEYA